MKSIQRFLFLINVAAGQDEADDPVQSDHVLSPPVLRCYPLYPNEREEADLGVSSLRQEGAVRAPHHRRVSPGRQTPAVSPLPPYTVAALPPGLTGGQLFVKAVIPFRRLFMEILNSCSDCDEIQFKEDGNWSPMRLKKEVQEVSSAVNGVANGQ